ncbi:NHLP bacteriocin export ABC transporter permease/ATPase subunit, partial [Thermodesulfobacteriota bacterium]
VFRMIGDRMGVIIRESPSATSARVAPLQAIAEASKISIREVALTGKWWTQDLGPLLGFMGADNRPVALLDRKPGRYVLHDPSEGTNTNLTDEVAAKIDPKAWVLIRPFPDKPLTGRDLIKFGVQGCGRDIGRTLLMAIAGGMLSLVTPLATSMLFDEIIPSENHSQLFKLVAVLSVAFISLTLFQLVQVLAQVRVEGKMVWNLQCAMWDRILALPVPFFRQFSAGDLANRSMGIDRIRQVVSGTALTTIVTAVFSGLQLGLLFYFSVELAIVALCLGVVLAIVPAVCLTMQRGYQTSLYKIRGRLQGFAVQVLNGIPKLRTHAAEERAFNTWAGQFATLRAASLRSGRVSNVLVAYSQSFGLVGILVILVWIFWTDDRPLQAMSVGGFLAFVSAFTIVSSSAHTMLLTLYPLLSVRALYRRTRPILQTLPEAPVGKPHPGELQGGVELSQVCFRYQRGGPLIIKSISLEVKPRESVAFVGPSGSGKTTLMRLLLGFERPESGSISYDRQALNQLDVQAVRRQIGVVLQNSTLMAGSIFENIVASAPLTMDDAWEALRKVDLEDEIKKMPMGIHTLIGEGGAGLSGGERQRLIMARALVRKPRILFFDEATSALDNQSQAWVTKNLEGLGITRIVIAQRLSTTRNADRICVLVDGRIVEIGSFDLLMTKGKVFPLLARRQLA